MLFYFTNVNLMEFLVRYLVLFLLFSVIEGFKWFWMGSLYKNIQSMLDFLKAPFLVLHFSYSTLMTFLVMLSVILLSMLMILLSILSVIGHMICGNNQNQLLNLNLKMNWGRKQFLDFSAGETQLVSFDWSINTGAIDVKMDGSVLQKKSQLKLLGLTFSSKLDWGSYIISFAKTPSKKIGVLVCSMKFLSLDVAPYLHKSTIHPCLECCCHIWAGAPSFYFELLGKLQKLLCGNFGPSLVTSPEPLDHCQNVAIFSLSYRYYCGRCSSKQALVPLPFSQVRFTHYSERLHEFSVTFPRYYNIQLDWNSLPGMLSLDL